MDQLVLSETHCWRDWQPSRFRHSLSRLRLELEEHCFQWEARALCQGRRNPGRILGDDRHRFPVRFVMVRHRRGCDGAECTSSQSFRPDFEFRFRFWFDLDFRFDLECRRPGQRWMFLGESVVEFVLQPARSEQHGNWRLETEVRFGSTGTWMHLATPT